MLSAIEVEVVLVFRLLWQILCPENEETIGVAGMEGVARET